MGNQQSGGMQLCSRGELYTNRGEVNTQKLDPETRVGYYVPTMPKLQAQRNRQIAQQQQDQEDLVEIPVPGFNKLKIPEINNIFEDDEVFGKFNIQCLGRQGEGKSRMLNSKDEGQAWIENYEDSQADFEGCFGKVSITNDGRIKYFDIAGLGYCENYNRHKIGKIFPMGISYGGLTKTIWFKEDGERDEAFEMMISLPPSYYTVVTNPTEYFLPNDHDREIDGSDHMKTFNGINGKNVIVHKESIALYTDIDENKHCVEFNKHSIMKCFPFGIHDGGLPRTIWFDSEMERDVCFISMRLNNEEPKFTGLYGSVVLHPETHVEFTSFSGDVVKFFYKPTKIQKVFPDGISYGELRKTIWFPDSTERNKCFEVMRQL